MSKELKIKVEEPTDRFIEWLAEELDTTPERIAENLLVWCAAEARAEMEGFHGHVAQTAEIMWAFIGGDDGMLKGTELYNMIWQQHTEEERLAREALARAKAAAGEELDEWEKAVIERDRKAAENHKKSLDAAKELEKYRESGLIPKELRGPAETFLRWISELEDGKITREQFDKRVKSYMEHSGREWSE